MKNKFFILLFAGLLITSCSKDDEMYAPMTDDAIVTVDQSPELQLVNPHLKGKAVTRPMKIKGSGELQYGPMCEPGKIFVQIIGEGKATHLGKFDLYLSYCRNLVPGVPGDGPEGYQMAANGDKLLTRMLYSGMEDDVFFQMYEYYPGGTGRFEEADGWVKLYFEFDYDENNLPIAYRNYGEGELTY